MKFQAAIIVAGLIAAPAAAHEGVTVDELTFGRSLNGIIEAYRVCGLPLSQLGDIPSRFDNFARSHRQYTQTMAQIYAKRNAAQRDLFAASPSLKQANCAKARPLAAQGVATAKRSATKLDEAHARAEAVKQ